MKRSFFKLLRYGLVLLSTTACSSYYRSDLTGNIAKTVCESVPFLQETDIEEEEPSIEAILPRARRVGNLRGRFSNFVANLLYSLTLLFPEDISPGR